MERLTKWENGHAYYPRCFENPCYGGGCVTRDCPFETAICERLAEYEDTGFSPEEIKSAFTPDASIKLAAQALGTTPERLRELAAADKEGRVLVMPCKFGDKLYRVFGKEIQEFTVSNVKYMGLQHRWSVDTTPFTLYAENLIGTEMFLTREDAERAMEGRKNG